MGPRWPLGVPQAHVGPGRTLGPRRASGVPQAHGSGWPLGAVGPRRPLALGARWPRTYVGKTRLPSSVPEKRPPFQYRERSLLPSGSQGREGPRSTVGHRRTWDSGPRRSRAQGRRGAYPGRTLALGVRWGRPGAAPRPPLAYGSRRPRGTVGPGWRCAYGSGGPRAYGRPTGAVGPGVTWTQGVRWGHGVRSAPERSLGGRGPPRISGSGC